jgi:hypothetical protein
MVMHRILILLHYLAHSADEMSLCILLICVHGTRYSRGHQLQFFETRV